MIHKGDCIESQENLRNSSFIVEKMILCDSLITLEKRVRRLKLKGIKNNSGDDMRSLELDAYIMAKKLTTI